MLNLVLKYIFTTVGTDGISASSFPHKHTPKQRSKVCLKWETNKRVQLKYKPVFKQAALSKLISSFKNTSIKWLGKRKTFTVYGTLCVHNVQLSKCFFHKLCGKFAISECFHITNANSFSGQWATGKTGKTKLDGTLVGTVKKCSDEARLPSGNRSFISSDVATQVCMGELRLRKSKAKQKKIPLFMCAGFSTGFRDNHVKFSF